MFSHSLLFVFLIQAVTTAEAKRTLSVDVSQLENKFTTENTAQLLQDLRQEARELRESLAQEKENHANALKTVNALKTQLEEVRSAQATAATEIEDDVNSTESMLQDGQPKATGWDGDWKSQKAAEEINTIRKNAAPKVDTGRGKPGRK
jgi:DNA repair exonuclease SbcCD ATPase subunit